MRVADSSFLLAVLNEEDRFHAAAVKDLADSEPITVPVEVLTETLGLIQARHGFAVARRFHHGVLGLPHVQLLDATAIETTFLIWDRGAGNLSWVDASVVHWSRKQHARPLTFDPDIRKAVEEAAS